MDFKCFNTKTTCIATLSVLVCALICLKMYLNCIILVPLLLILWIYVIILVKSNFRSNTSIEVNIIDPMDGLDAEIRAKNLSDLTKSRHSKKKIRYHVPKFMLELYKKNKSAGKENAKPDLVRSLIPTQAEKLLENDILEELSENHLLIFDIPASNKGERFIGAILKILTQVEINSRSELGVSKTLKISSYDEQTKKYYSLREIDVHHYNNTWLSFDLTKEVEQILQMNSDEKFLKIVITIVSSYFRQSKNNLKLSLLPVFENFDHDYPILLLSYSIDEEKREKPYEILNERRTNIIRKRRSVEEDYEEETNMIWSNDLAKKNALKKYKRNNCRRRPLYISFSEIEYDLWIVQPSGYEAYQCQGRCFYPVAEHLSPTKHAIMQALIHSVDPSKASKSCCVPTVLDSISILYVDGKGVLTYRYAYKDMVVLECGCR